MKARPTEIPDGRNRCTETRNYVRCIQPEDHVGRHAGVTGPPNKAVHWEQETEWRSHDRYRKHYDNENKWEQSTPQSDPFYGCACDPRTGTHDHDDQ